MTLQTQDRQTNRQREKLQCDVASPRHEAPDQPRTFLTMAGCDDVDVNYLQIRNKGSTLVNPRGRGFGGFRCAARLSVIRFIPHRPVDSGGGPMTVSRDSCPSFHRTESARRRSAQPVSRGRGPRSENENGRKKGRSRPIISIRFHFWSNRDRVVIGVSPDPAEL